MTAITRRPPKQVAWHLAVIVGIAACVSAVIIFAIHLSIQEAVRKSELVEIPTVPGDYETWPSQTGKDAQAVMESYGRNYRHRKVRGAQLVVRIGEDHKARLFYKVYYDQH